MAILLLDPILCGRLKSHGDIDECPSGRGCLLVRGISVNGELGLYLCSWNGSKSFESSWNRATAMNKDLKCYITDILSSREASAQISTA